jgi:hypothetical protein
MHVGCGKITVRGIFTESLFAKKISGKHWLVAQDRVHLAAHLLRGSLGLLVGCRLALREEVGEVRRDSSLVDQHLKIEIKK